MNFGRGSGGAGRPGSRDRPTPVRSGSAFYVPGANGRALVNSRVSGAVSALVDDATADGESLRANSSFRSSQSQQRLCNGDALCRAGNFGNVARPEYSNHQMGLAVDFAGPTAKGG
jgi:LAS superfamily LD-carboxypeptidase LdcB